MSRCFPFPPPGYENKARPVDLNLIIKEKHKHKRHKDKKDKDKKERSERKDRERTEGKHKEDKDRKQKKHGNKKDKKKEKRKSSEEKKIVRPSDNQNGEKPEPDNKPGDGAHDCKILVELGKRVRNDDEATNKKKDKQKSSEEKKIVGPSENQNGEKPSPDNKPGDRAHNCRILVEMGKRVRSDYGSTDKKDKKKQKSSEEKKIAGPLGNQGDEKPGPDSNDYRILVEMGKRVRNNDGAKDNSHVSMDNGQSLGVDTKCLGNNWIGEFSGEKRIKVEDGPCQTNMVEKGKEGKEKNGDGFENENRDKNRKEDKKRKKEEEKEKVKERSKEKVKGRESDGNLVDYCVNKPEDLVKETWDRQGKLPKLKEPVLNGFLHDSGTWPDNMSRPEISCHQVVQNGNSSHPSQTNTISLTMEKQAVITNQKVNGKLSPSQSVIKNVRNMESGRTANNSTTEHPKAHINNHAVSNGFISSHPLVENGRKTARPNNIDKIVDGPRPVFSHETDNKEFGVNGLLEGKKDISSRPSSASVKPPREKADSFVKKAPPHPDLKYLSQILTVPKLDSPPFDDDQDWLLGCKDAKKPALGPSEIECKVRVWAEAIRLEGADVTVLPYVVPY